MKLRSLLLAVSAATCCMNTYAAVSSATVITTPPITVTATLTAPVVGTNEAKTYSSVADAVLWHMTVTNPNVDLARLTVLFDTEHARNTNFNGLAISATGTSVPVYLWAADGNATTNGIALRTPLGKNGVYSFDVKKEGTDVWAPGSYNTVLTASLYN